MDQHTRTRDLVSAFFGRFHFDVQGPSVRTVVDVLRADMVRGLEEEAQLPPRMGSALAMIPTWVAPPPCIPLQPTRDSYRRWRNQLSLVPRTLRRQWHTSHREFRKTSHARYHP